MLEISTNFFAIVPFCFAWMFYIFEETDNQRKDYLLLWQMILFGNQIINTIVFFTFYI